MFENLTKRLQTAFKDLGRRGRLRPEDVDGALREIRLALLEADVHYQVVKELLARVRERALESDVSRALNPAQQVIQIIQQELTQQLGQAEGLQLRGEKPRVILLVGLQGSGKTTTAAKLARLLKSKGERVWMIAADPYRPAAAEQLRILGDSIGVETSTRIDGDAIAACRNGLEEAARSGASVAIIDSAGRQQIDPELMDELAAMQREVHPSETLLVADAMTGQEAVGIAQGFEKKLPLTGLILTKLDGDARGGAAISMHSVTGLPIKFAGVGEALDALEPFDPDRMASRILGMGDVLSIIEKAQAVMDVEDAERQAERMLQGEFTLEDFAQQIAAVRRMGPLGKLMEMLPTGAIPGAAQVDKGDAERQLLRTQAILGSMTPVERRKPDLLNASRKRRIAAGSGTTVQEVNQLLRQYRQMRRVMKTLGKGGLPKIGSWPL
ncbi:MAG: signal recognition particle protein [Anaerolineales bacterium]